MANIWVYLYLQLYHDRYDSYLSFFSADDGSGGGSTNKQTNNSSMIFTDEFGEEAEIKRALAELEKDGKIFMHKDGDIYTHKPK